MRTSVLITLLAMAGVTSCTNDRSAPAASAGGAPRAGIPRVDGAEAHKLVQAGALLVDVRTEEEFADRHIEGARNIPVDRIEASLASLPRDRPVVVYCAAGGRAARAATLLQSAGVDVRNLGAMAAWGN